MKEKKKNKIYGSKTFWIIVSLLCSVIIWSYVSDQDESSISRTFTGVEVVLAGQDELLSQQNLSITNLDTRYVSIEIRGSRSNIGSLRASDIKAVIDVSTFTRANGMSCFYDLQFPSTVNEGDITIVSRTPHMVNFTIVKNIVKSVEVKGSFEGQIAEGCVADELIFEPAEVKLEGPEELLNKVDSAWVSFGNGKINEDYTEEAQFTLLDADGNAIEVSGFSVLTESITATQPVLRTKDVPLKLNIIGGGGVSADDCTVSIEPKKISIAIDAKKADHFNEIVLDDVDLAEITEGFENTYTIPVPEGVKNLTGTAEAKVKLVLPELFTKSVKATNIDCTNVTSGYTASVDTQEVDVLLRSVDAEALDSVNPNNVTVTADLSDYGTTTGQVIVSATAETNDERVGAIGEIKVTVTISKGKDNINL